MIRYTKHLSDESPLHSFRECHFYVNDKKVIVIGSPRHLPDTMSDFDFAALARTEQHARTRIRFLGMAHLNEGYLYREVAQFLGVHLTTVQDWVQRFSEKGLDGLRESPRSGHA